MARKQTPPAASDWNGPLEGPIAVGGEGYTARKRNMTPKNTPQGRFNGDLSAFSLFEVCQFLMIIRQTGTLRIQRERERATLAFSDGQIVNVILPGLPEGAEAFYALAAWQTGTFDYAPGPVAVPSRPVVGLSTDGLLLEAARRIDEGEILPGQDEEDGARSRARAVLENHKHAIKHADLLTSLGKNAEQSLDFQEEVLLEDILDVARQRRASRVYLRVGEDPKARVGDRIVSLGKAQVTQRALDRIVSKHFPDEGQGDVLPAMGALRTCEKLVEGHGHVLLESGRFVEGNRLTLTLLSPAAPLLDAFGIEADKIFRTLLEPKGILLVSSPPRGGKSALAASLTFAVASLKQRHVVHYEESRQYHLMETGGLLESWELPRTSADVPSIPEQVWSRKADVLVIDAVRNQTHVEGALEAALSGAMVVVSVEADQPSDAVARFLLLVEEDRREEAASRLAHTLNGILFVAPRSGAAAGEERRAYRGRFIPRSPALAEAILTGDPAALRRAIGAARITRAAA